MPFFTLSTCVVLLGQVQPPAKPPAAPKPQPEAVKVQHIWFLQNDANRDGVITPAELSRRFAKHFVSTDTNRDGKLQKNEVILANNKIGNQARKTEKLELTADGQLVPKGTKLKNLFQGAANIAKGLDLGNTIPGMNHPKNTPPSTTTPTKGPAKTNPPKKVTPPANPTAVPMPPADNNAKVETIIARLMRKLDSNQDNKLQADELKGKLASHRYLFDANDNNILEPKELRDTLKIAGKVGLDIDQYLQSIDKKTTTKASNKK